MRPAANACELMTAMLTSCDALNQLACCSNVAMPLIAACVLNFDDCTPLACAARPHTCHQSITAVTPTCNSNSCSSNINSHNDNLNSNSHALQAASYTMPGQSRSTTPGPAEVLNPKAEPKQDRGGTPPVPMGASKTESRQDRGMTPPVQHGTAFPQAGTQGQLGNALPQGQQGTALPQTASGHAGSGAPQRQSPYYSRRSPSPLPMRHSGQLLRTPPMMC